MERTAIKNNADKQVIEQAVTNPLSSMRSIVKSSLYYFVRYFWDELSNDEFHDNWHIKYLCDECQKVIERVEKRQPKLYDLIINIPPGTTKSTIVSRMLPVWAWTRSYWMKFITGSYGSTLSLELAEDSRDLLRSERFGELFPELGIKQDKEQKSNFKVVKKEWVRKNSVPRQHQGGGRFSTSVGSGVMGFHGHVIIIDDPLNPKQALSEVELLNANRWVSSTLSSRKTDKEKTPIILIMQRLHQNDVTGDLLDRKDNIKHICLPASLDNTPHLVKPKELKKYYQDGLLDPVRLNRNVLKEAYSEGQYVYSSQYDQDPVPAGGGMFQIDNIPVIEAMPARVNITKTVRYWDKAGSEGTGAYTVGTKMCRLKSGKWIIIDVVRGQWSSEKREKIIRQTAEADGYNTTVYIEQEPGSGGKESAMSTVRNLEGFACYRDLPTGNKEYRADPFSVQVNEGNVMMLRGDWNAKFREELRYFPFSTYKDQVDSASGAFAKLVIRKKAGKL
jgi:predicted phage terminase large subunit-like protein